MGFVSLDVVFYSSQQSHKGREHVVCDLRFSLMEMAVDEKGICKRQALGNFQYQSSHQMHAISYEGTKYALSIGSRGNSQANQSDLVVLRKGKMSAHTLSSTPTCIGSREKTYGNNPIPLTFQIPNPNANKLHPINANLTITICDLFPSVSRRANVPCTFSKAVIGVLNSINTIIMLKICSELPVMYMPKAFIGRDLAGAMASSQAFFSLRVSISSGKGCLRGVTFLLVLEDLAAVVKPGGSGMLLDLALVVAGAVLRSISHCGWGVGEVWVIFAAAAV